MPTVISKDGTPIAFEQSGSGPALILVVGAFNDHMTGMPLAQKLERHFTVFNYDRRGRGNSGDTLPYAVEREVEDLDALIAEAGGSAYVFGYSSGAVLALKAAASGLAISKLALYEAPLMMSSTPVEEPSQGHISTVNGQPIETSNNRSHLDANLADEIAKLVSEGRRGDAVELFQTQVVGIPAEVVAQMRHAPFRPALEKMAHTLVYELTIINDMSASIDVLGTITIPTLVMAGGHSPKFLQNGAKAIAAAVPHGKYRILEGQTHDIVAEVVAPVVEAFLMNG